MNKIIASIILAITLVFVINKITNSIYHVDKPQKSAYQVDVAVTSESSETKELNSEAVNIMALFASTSAGEGQKIFKKCAACHSIAQGGANKIGPALWGVLGRNAGSHSDYKYSKAMVAYGFMGASVIAGVFSAFDSSASAFCSFTPFFFFFVLGLGFK